MKLPVPFRRKPPARPLSAQLDNPYRPIYGRERRFEELTGPRAPSAGPGKKPGPGAK